MANKLITKSELSLQVEESNSVLPDESDKIIGDLKKELADLKNQLRQYDPSEDKKEVPADLQIHLQIKKYQIASLLTQETIHEHRQKILPKVMEQAQQPIHQMTRDLENIISGVHDPAVKATLGQCFSVLENVDRLSQKSKQLDQAPQPIPKKVELLSFFRRIAREQNKGEGTPVKLFSSPRVPQSIYVDEELFKRSILILLKKVSHLSDDETLSITLRQSKEVVYDVPVKQLKISLFGEASWQLPKEEEMEAFLEHCLGVDEDWGVDYLYAKKIVEEHGGQLDFHRKDEEVVGFEILLPNEKQ